MSIFPRFGKNRSINFLELIPERAYEWVEQENGRVSILVPKYGTSRLGLWLARRLKKPYIFIKLDEVGTAVWLACDGRTTIRQIGIQLQQRFGDQIEPVYERMAIFFRALDREKLIRWTNLN